MVCGSPPFPVQNLEDGSALFLGFGAAYADNKYLQKQFDELDRDVNGLISHDEVQSQPSLVRFMNLYNQDSFWEADVNKDGVLDREELLDCW